MMGLRMTLASSIGRFPAALALLAALGLGEAAAEPAATDLLFETPYLSQVEAGTTLSYRFARLAADEAKLGPSYDDKIDLTLMPGAEGNQRTAVVNYFSGERHRAAGPFPDMTGNPVVMLFLEQDVLAMSKMLRSNPRYIRNRLRTVLNDEAAVEPARFSFDGREIEGWKISFRPFVEDMNRDKFGEFAKKRYEFVIADAVPGGIYEMRTVTQQAEEAKGSWLEERLTFAGARR